MGVFLVLGLALLCLLIIKMFIKAGKKPSPNPFSEDARKPIKPKVNNSKERDAVLKQGFNMEKVPTDLDAIVIGSGIGGLGTAAILSKAGKKVLVLEQHDQAGGCCHTFIEKGYEFDVGIHYIGDMAHHSMTKTFLDQISDGQIEWEPLDEEFDRIIFKEPGKDIRSYPMYSTFEDQKRNLKERFAGEEAAIDKYYDLCFESEKNYNAVMIVKFIPLWLVKLAEALKITGFFSKYWELNSRTVKEVVDDLTENQELRDIMCYCFGDYGTEPSKAGFPMQATLMTHFMKGRAAYPIGGASEIAFHIIPVIERGGGKVLVRAEVEEILMANGAAAGVRVKHGRNTFEIKAPLIISNAGALKTISKFLPENVGRDSRLWSVFKRIPQGVGAMSVFVGLDATPEELGIPSKKNMWIFTKKNIDQAFIDYYNLSGDEAEDCDVPLLFLSFPSTKDPTWDQRYPGKTSVTLITLAHYKWFSDWSENACQRRGDDYEARKKTIGHKLIDHMCDLFPKVRDHIDYVNIGSPVTNNFYLGATQGEIYGMDHSRERFNAINSAILRPQTDIPGLFLTGQDVCSAGFVGGLYGGLISAYQILDRNLMKDLADIHQKTFKTE